MQSASTHRSDQPSNWQQYIDILDSKGIDEKQRRWYVIHVENLLDRNNKKPLSLLASTDVEAYFTAKLSHIENAWQARQLVDAIQLLLVDLVNAPAAKLIE